MKFPYLYKKTKTGKVSLWKVWTKDDTIYRVSGFINGKMRDPVVKKAIGKNIGKKNETRPKEQAEKEAKALWVKQIDKGYEPGNDDKNGWKMLISCRNEQSERYGQGKNQNNDKTYLPMLANQFEKYKDGWLVRPTIEEPNKGIPYINWPKHPYIQPKLDGVRCIAYLNNNNVILQSRNGKPFRHLNHLRNDLKELLKDRNLILDGEIYASKIKENDEFINNEERFRIISGSCRPTRTNPHKLEDQLEYHVFDLIDLNGEMNQQERFDILHFLFQEKEEFGKIKAVKTFEIASEREIYTYHDVFFKEGYEGVIIRDKSLKYKLKYRSSQLLKYKQFKDEEFTIINAKEGSGTEKGAVVWMCETETGDTFECRPQGTMQKRRRWYNEKEKYIGKKLKVKYQSKDPNTNIPRFPVGIEIRTYL